MRSYPVEKVLESVLNGYQLRVEVITDARYCGSWYEEEPHAPRGQFHLIDVGECMIMGPMLKEPIRLRGGDLAIFPHGTRHTLASVPAAWGMPGHGFTSMLCGELEFLTGAGNPVLQALPECLVVHSSDGGESFRSVANVLIAASRENRLGQRIVMNKLADSLFTLAVCEYAHHAQDPNGIFAALVDPRMARALEAIHSRASEKWTLASLAAVAGMSRSAFALHFNEVMGVPPMQYLTAWRVTQAKQMLQDRRLSVATIAERLGYKSEAAFRKLFKRIEGVGPGKARAYVRDGDYCEDED